MTSLFAPALQELERSGTEWLPPQSFRDYAKRAGFPATRTAQHISVQELGSLDGALRAANVMVFRLGAGQFALLRAERTVEEFFLIDDARVREPRTFVPDVSVADLFPFELLGTLTETGAVNLATAAGLLGYALECDQPFPRVAPATGSSTYDFLVRPHTRLPDLSWPHARGQVEIDAVFLGRRSGHRVLFVIEAKHGKPSVSSSLAKAKLAYPCSAIATKRVPADIPIVPVYLRSWPADDGRRILFCIKECRPWDRDRGFVSGLEVVCTKLLQMEFGL